MTKDLHGGGAGAASRAAAAAGTSTAAAEGGARLADLHVRLGWWTLLVFIVLGSLLEAFHGFKVQWYLAVTNETRRHLWTLAHAHGTLLALVNIAFGLTLRARPRVAAAPRALASRALFVATALLPGGFFLGGSMIYAGDPGLGVLLVPLGAALLALAVFLTAREVAKA
jgi:hypothetical protein